jgi:hypothetical protein
MSRLLAALACLAAMGAATVAAELGPPGSEHWPATQVDFVTAAPADLPPGGSSAGELESSLRKLPEAPDAAEPHRITGFLDFNYYWDTRQFNTLTINAGAMLPCDVDYFQFVDFDSPLDQPATVEDLSGFYTEIHLGKPIAKDSEWLDSLDWTWMYADGSLARDVHRLGIRWRTEDSPGLLGALLTDVLALEYAVNLHFVESDGSGIQIEHVYRRVFLDRRFYIAGFADHDINTDGSTSWVTEHQMGLRLVDEVHLVAEYRYNEFLPTEFRSGWGFGLEYVVQFQ